MKRIHIVIIIVLVVLGVSLFHVIGPGRGRASQAMPQEEIVEDLTARLIEQGVPIKSVEATKMTSEPTLRNPNVIEFVLQSSSEGDSVAPEDPLYKHAVRREVYLAQKLGLDVGATTVSIVDTQGKVLVSGTVVVKHYMGSEFDPPHKLDNDAVAALLRQQLDFCGMSLEKLDVFLDGHGLRWAVFELKVPDIETANATLGKFMYDIEARVEALNAKLGAQIAVYQVNLDTAKGEPLLRYVCDWQLCGMSWWQPDELTARWFPVPAVAVEQGQTQ